MTEQREAAILNVAVVYLLEHPNAISTSKDGDPHFIIPTSYLTSKCAPVHLVTSMNDSYTKFELYPEEAQ